MSGALARQLIHPRAELAGVEEGGGDGPRLCKVRAAAQDRRYPWASELFLGNACPVFRPNLTHLIGGRRSEIQPTRETMQMTTTPSVTATAARASKMVGMAVLAIVALAPLSPVIALMYVVKWLCGPDTSNDSVTVFGQGNRPVYCLHSVREHDRGGSDRFVSPFAHPAANRRPGRCVGSGACRT